MLSIAVPTVSMTQIGKNRIPGITKENRLLSPHRGIQAPQDPHDGTIITDEPNVMKGSQYTSDYFLKQISYMDIQEGFGLIKQPQTNGVAERFNRTLTEQILK